MVNKKDVVCVLVVMGAGFVNALSQRRRAAAEYSEHRYLQQNNNNSTTLMLEQIRDLKPMQWIS